MKMRTIKILLIIICCVIIANFYQRHMILKDKERFDSRGESYCINSHNMSIYCRGEGDNTIVFVSGSGTPCSYTDFYNLQNDLMPYAKTISFDHAGFGWSDDTDIDRTVENLVDDLHKLLEKSGNKGPYILVGHSMASLEMIGYAQEYPDDLKGIVLIDGGSPEYYAKASQSGVFLLNRSLALLRESSFIRLLSNVGIKIPIAASDLRYDLLPEDIKALDEAMYNEKLGNASNISVINNMNYNGLKVIEHGKLEDIPLLILSSDHSKEWNLVQKQLLSWSINSNQIIIENSNHYIHWSNRGEVVIAIKEFINLLK